MAEAAPVAPIPSATTQARPAVAPTAPAAAPPPPPVEAKPSIDYVAQLKQLEADRVKERRAHVVERQKWMKTQEEARTRAEKLASLEKREAQAKLNPAEYLQSIYGEKWYDTLVETKLNGVPPAALIASEVEKVRDEFKATLEADRKAQAEAAQAAQSKAVEASRRQVLANSAKWYESSGKDYPLLEGLGAPESVSRFIAQRIESVFNSSTEVDESGEVVTPGRLLTPAQAAEAIEAELVAIAERALGAEKYREKLAPKVGAALGALTKGPKAASVAAQQQESTSQESAAQTQARVVRRRSGLTNEITGTTPPKRATPQSEAERFERAIQAFQAIHKR